MYLNRFFWPALTGLFSLTRATPYAAACVVWVPSEHWKPHFTCAGQAGRVARIAVLRKPGGCRLPCATGDSGCMQCFTLRPASTFTCRSTSRPAREARAARAAAASWVAGVVSGPKRRGHFVSSIRVNTHVLARRKRCVPAGLCFWGSPSGSRDRDEPRLVLSCKGGRRRGPGSGAGTLPHSPYSAGARGVEVDPSPSVCGRGWLALRAHQGARVCVSLQRGGSGSSRECVQ